MKILHILYIFSLKSLKGWWFPLPPSPFPWCHQPHLTKNCKMCDWPLFIIKWFPYNVFSSFVLSQKDPIFSYIILSQYSEGAWQLGHNLRGVEGAWGTAWAESSQSEAQFPMSPSPHGVILFTGVYGRVTQVNSLWNDLRPPPHLNIWLHP